MCGTLGGCKKIGMDNDKPGRRIMLNSWLVAVTAIGVAGVFMSACSGHSEPDAVSAPRPVVSATAQPGTTWTTTPSTSATEPSSEASATPTSSSPVSEPAPKPAASHAGGQNQVRRQAPAAPARQYQAPAPARQYQVPVKQAPVQQQPAPAPQPAPVPQPVQETVQQAPAPAPAPAEDTSWRGLKQLEDAWANRPAAQ